MELAWDLVHLFAVQLHLFNKGQPQSCWSRFLSQQLPSVTLEPRGADRKAASHLAAPHASCTGLSHHYSKFTSITVFFPNTIGFPSLINPVWYKSIYFPDNLLSHSKNARTWGLLKQLTVKIQLRRTHAAQQAYPNSEKMAQNHHRRMHTDISKLSSVQSFAVPRVLTAPGFKYLKY